MVFELVCYLNVMLTSTLSSDIFICLKLIICFVWQKIADDDKVFYGIKAPKEIFETYRYLLEVSDAYNWSCEQQRNMPQSTR